MSASATPDFNSDGVAFVVRVIHDFWTTLYQAIDD